ncbi:hypothetical protein ACFE04_022549 [Oxalis oulophora]
MSTLATSSRILRMTPVHIRIEKFDILMKADLMIYLNPPLRRVSMTFLSKASRAERYIATQGEIQSYSCRALFGSKINVKIVEGDSLPDTVMDEESVDIEIELKHTRRCESEVLDTESQQLFLAAGDEFRKLFGLPPYEALSQEFSCSYKETSIKGTLYLFVQYICFYSEVFELVIKEQIPFSIITSIQKGKTEGAIEIIAANQTYLFLSFLERDEAFELINDGLQQHGNRALSISEEQKLLELEVVDAPTAPGSRQLVKSKFPIKAQELFNLFFTNGASDFLESFHMKCGDEGFSCSTWRPHYKYGYLRDVSFRNPYSMMFVKTSKEFNDGPYGDCFRIESQWFIKADDDDEEEDTCTVLVYAHVTFTKRTIWKEGIMEEMLVEGKRTCEVWVSMAHEMLTKMGIQEREVPQASNEEKDEESGFKIWGLSRSRNNFSKVVRTLATVKTIILYIREAVGMGNDGLGNIGEDYSEGSDSSGSKMAIVQTVGFIAVTFQTVRQVAGMVKAKVTEKNSKPRSVDAYAHSDATMTEQKKDPSRDLHSGITYEIMDEGQGQCITKYQQACFQFKQSSSTEVLVFEVHVKSGQTAKSIKAFVKAIQGMKLNEKRIIVISPEVTGLKDNTYLDLTLTSMDILQLTKPSPLAKKLTVIRSLVVVVIGTLGLDPCLILSCNITITLRTSRKHKEKYYDLCCSQNAFLHDNIAPGINHKLTAGTISDTVNIADYLSNCKLTTSQDDFSSWEKSLEAFELLGMNIGFLRARLTLVKLAFESEGGSCTRRYAETKSEKSCAEEEMKGIEAKLEELNQVSGKCEAQIKSLKPKADGYEAIFGVELKLFATVGRSSGYSPGIPLAVVQKSTSESEQGAQQSENGSEVDGSEVLESYKLPTSTFQFSDVKSFDDFSILVDGSLIDSELQENIRKKYYDLCCSQHTFLHENIVPGINHKLIAGTILETVRIADNLSNCKLTTSRDEFSGWENSLKALELLGLNVGFLCARLSQLVKISSESGKGSFTRRYIKAKIEKSLLEKEIKSFEEKFEERKKVFGKCEAEIESMKTKADGYEAMFQKEVAAPW